MPVTVKDKVESSPQGEPEPTTPDAEGDEQQRPGLACLPTAPRRKPNAPPLIQRKIKPNEAGVDAAPGSGSKIPLLKTKQTERESMAEDHGRTSLSNLRLHPSGRQSLQDFHKIQRSKDAKNSVPERAHRSVERVKVSKGIEMKRVVQESNGVTSKRFSQTKLATSSTTKLFNEASQRARSSERTTGKKMTRTEVSCPDAKSLTSLRNTRSVAATGKSAHVSKPTESNTAIQSQPTNSEKAAIEAASSFKTVEEFLKMPETSLPDGPTSSTSKKSLFKSKFWEYIDPSAKPPSTSKCKQQKKTYDPDEVKSFMDKQKETRKLQQLKESKEKQLETEKRMRMLKDLDSKCHRIALKAKHKEESPAPDQIVDTDQAKKRKMELESPSLKYLKPLLEHHKHGSLQRKSSDNFRADTTKQAQYLLSEFENIVKRECISFLHRIPIPSDVNMASPSIEKVDKAVGTSIADSESKSQDTSCGKDESMEVTDDVIKTVPSPAAVERAVTKIQACFRGYKVRQALKEAKIYLRKPWSKCNELEQLQERSRPRRWSFPKPPEKPYDSNSINARLFPMSPIPMTGVSTEPLIPCYIPPPPPPVSSSPPRPKVLPSSPFTPVRMRVYDDPYPKQMKRAMDGSSTSANNSVRHSLPNTFDDFVIPTPLPSLVDVLREKIRLFSAGSDSAFVPPTATSQHKFEQKQESPLGVITKAKTVSTLADGNETGAASQPLPLQHVPRVVQESGTTPKTRKHKRRSRGRSKGRSSSPPAGDSSTTADTDLEYLHHLTHSQSVATVATSQKHTPKSTTSSRSESSVPSSVVNEPSISSSLGDFLAPALRLRYEAEKEHLKIIERALQVKLDGHVAGEVIQSEKQKHESPNDRGKKSSPESDRVQLAIANCHKESMKAAAEMAKWMADFQKTTQQQDKVQQTPRDLAAMVYAAVEEARITGEEKRREKQFQQVSQSEIAKSNDFSNLQEQRSHHSIQNGEGMLKVDKSAETSLSLFKNNEVAKTLDLTVRALASEQIRRDYQQQFPSASESERGSPSPVPLTPSSISAHVSRMSSVLADYTNSRLSGRVNDRNQLISPPSSSSSTLKSTGILSEARSNESPKTDQVQIVELPPSTIDSSVKEIEVNESSIVDEEQEDKSSENEIQEILPLPGSDVQTDEVLSEKAEASEVDYNYSEVEDEEVNEKSAEVSMAIVATDEEVDADISPVQMPDESLKSSQLYDEHFLTFESDTDSPLPSKQSIEADIATDESNRENLESSNHSIINEENKYSKKSESPVEEENNKSPPKISPPCSGTYSIESVCLSTSPQPQVGYTKNVDAVEDGDGHEKSHEEEPKSESKEEEGAPDLQTKNLEAQAPELSLPNASNVQDAAEEAIEEVSVQIPEESIQDSEQDVSSAILQPEPIVPNDTNVKDENEASVEDNEASNRIPHEIIQDSEQHVSSEYESEGVSLALSKDKSADSSVIEKDDEEPMNQNVEVEEIESLAKSGVEEMLAFSIHMKPPPPYSPSSAFNIPSPVMPTQSNDELGAAAIDEKLETEHVTVDQITDPHDESTHSEDEKNESLQEKLSETTSAVIAEQQPIIVAEDSSKDGREQVQPNELFIRVAQDEAAAKFDNQVKTEGEIPMKPPPPYSPSSSLDSTSLSSRSLIISVQKDRIERIVREEADLVWESWRKDNSPDDLFPDADTIINGMTSEPSQDQIDMGSNGNPDITQSALQSFDSLLHHLVYETIKDVLQVENSFTSYIERVRPGPLALQAQKLKIPKTKESLISCVIKRVTAAIPANFFPEPVVHTSDKYRGKKWCSRPKELVDEILLEELVEEDYQWTEWWPEQVIVEHIESKEIIKRLVNSVLKNRKYVYSQ